MSRAIYAVPIDPDTPPARAEVVNFLKVDELPMGISRLFVELVGDGLASGIRVPVLVAKGTDGPTFGITACIHGNELNGIPVIHRLFRELDVSTVRGTIVGVVALNVPGLHLKQRGFIDGTDLNRIMPGKPNGSIPDVYAYRILERIVDQFDYLLDLHTASYGRVNSLYVRADMKNTRTAAMAYLQSPEIIVHNPASDTTLRGAAMDRGIPAITVEIGNPGVWQERYTSGAYEGVMAVLKHEGFIEGKARRSDSAPPVLCSSSSWMYTDRGGLLEVFPKLVQRLTEGEEVAIVRDAFGNVIRRYQAGRNGIVIGKSINPVGQTGARILHLGVVEPVEGVMRPRDCGLDE